MRPRVTVNFRATTRDLMEAKNCYDMLQTDRVVQFLFEEGNRGKQFVRIVSADPDAVNPDVVLFKIEAELL